MPGVPVALTAFGVAAVGAVNTYQVAAAGGWIWALIVGAGLPASVLFEWWHLRSRSPEAADVADKMLVAILVTLICLGDAAGAF
jgi:hypothetical protein